MTQNIIQCFPNVVHREYGGPRRPLTEERMEQKAKRIGKFNIIDIIAVVLILAVAVFAGWKLMNRGGGDGGEAAMVKVTYTVKCEGVPAELYENCLSHLPSPLMASGRPGGRSD